MLDKETYNALPDAAKAAFVEQDGQYVTVKDAALKKTLDDLDSKYKSEAQRLKEMEEKLSGFEAAKAAEIEAARAKALEEARSKGDVKAIEERYQQQMADLEKRTREDAKAEALKEFKTEQAQSKASALADKIGLTVGVDQYSGEAIADLIRSRVKVDPDTGATIFHDAKGSALSVDKDGFIKELAKEPRFSRLIKADLTTTGGGNANGNSGGGAPAKALNQMTATEEALFAKQYPEQYERLLNQ